MKPYNYTINAKIPISINGETPRLTLLEDIREYAQRRSIEFIETEDRIMYKVEMQLTVSGRRRLNNLLKFFYGKKGLYYAVKPS